MSLAPMRATAPRVEPRRESEPARPRLRIVGAAAPDAARAPYFALCVAILLGALLGALALNTSMAATAYTIRDRTLDYPAPRSKLRPWPPRSSRPPRPAR